MSTKTSIKRIALVAVAALGFGMVSTVSANAAVTSARTVLVDTDGAGTTGASATVYAAATGVAKTVGVYVTTVTAADAAEVISVTPTITSSPAGSAVTVGAAGAGKAGMITTGYDNTAAMNTTAADSKWTLATASGVNTLTFNATTGPALTAKKIGALSLTADKQGKYVISLAISSTTGTGSNTNATITIYVSDLYATTADGLTSGNTSNISVNGVAGAANTATLAAYQQGTTTRLVTVEGSSAKISTVGSLSGNSIAADGLSAIIGAGSAGSVSNSTLTVTTPAVGTVTVKIFDQSQAGIFSATPLATVTITVNSTAVNGSLDVASSTATLNVTGVTGAYLDADVATKAYAPRTAATKAATVVVALASNAGTLSSTTATTISVTGPGIVGFDMASDGTADNSGRSLTYTGTDGDFWVIISGDGTSGASTVTVTTGTFTKSFSINFYGSVAKYEVTGGNSYLAVGVTDSSIATVKALDAAGIAVPAAVIYVTSSSTATATASSNTITTATDGSAAAIGATAVAKGATTFTFANAASAATVTATHALNVVTAGIASVSLSFDKDEYAPGELVTVTVLAKNSDGDVAGDATYANLFTSAGLTGSTVLQGYTASASVTTVSGKKAYTFYAPLVEGPVVVKGTLDTSVATAIQATVVSGTTKVVAADGGTSAAIDAANEATDAANAATDAANAAAEAADAATAAAQDAQAAVAELATKVASLIAGIKAQITTLTNLVIKIQKKVRA